MGLPWWLRGKEPACDAGTAGDMGSIPGSGRFPGGGRGNLLQNSCLEKPMDRGAGYSPQGYKELTRLRTYAQGLIHRENYSSL